MVIAEVSQTNSVARIEPAQIAATGVRYLGDTVASIFEPTGMPSSRLKAKSMRLTGSDGRQAALRNCEMKMRM